MNIKVRYFSASGNTKKIADAIAEELNIEAISIKDEPELKEHTDLLFLGGAPYANIMAKPLKEYALNIKKEDVDKIVLFTTSNWSRRTVRALKKILKEKGIKVYDKYLYVHMLKVKSSVVKSEIFAEEILNEYRKDFYEGTN